MKTSKFNIVIIAVLTIFVKSNLYAQFDRYSDEYHEGNIELIDGSFSEGKIKTHLLQKARLKFISKERIDEVEKYKLAEVKRFRIDSADFIILRDVVLIDSYAREGTNKFCIGEIIYDSVDI